MDTTEIDIAWAAGLFEGKGCIVVYGAARKGRSESFSVRLTLGSTDHDVLARFHRIVDCGWITQQRKAEPHHKQLGCWKISERLLKLWLPFFGERRSTKARQALAVLEQVRKELDRVCYCGQRFTAVNMSQIYCGTKCRVAANHIANRERNLARHRAWYRENRDEYLARRRAKAKEA